MVLIQDNALSFFVDDIDYGSEITIAINGQIVKTFTNQLDKAKMGVYLNKKRNPYLSNN